MGGLSVFAPRNLPNRIPAGFYVAPAIGLVHTDPDVYPDPDEFRPERFLDRRVAPDE